MFNVYSTARWIFNGKKLEARWYRLLKALVRSSRNWWFNKGFFIALKGKMIRKAKIKDLKVVYSLLQEGVTSGKVLKRSLKELKTVIKNFFVYEENYKVIGCCSLEIYSQRLAEIRSLVVSSEYRSRGIGSALVKRCLDEAKNKGIYQVLSVTDKRDLFEKLGFKSEVDEKQAMFVHLKN